TVLHGLPRRRRRGLSAREERAKLVAIEVAEVARVKSLAARACRAFVLSAQRDGALVNLVHLPLALGRKRNHDAVANGGLVAVSRLDHVEHRCIGTAAPGDIALRLRRS